MPFLPWVATIGSVTPPLSLANGGTGVSPASDAALFTALGALGVQAATAVAGYTLVNGTGNVITWTAPNDGALHGFLVVGSMSVTSAETGGQISVQWTTPSGVASGGGIALIAGGHAAGVFQGTVNGHVQAGQQVIVNQQAALTVGAAVLWATIYGQ